MKSWEEGLKKGFILLAMLLASCNSSAPPTKSSAPTLARTRTALIPVSGATQTAHPTATETAVRVAAMKSSTPTGSAADCLQLVNPENGFTLAGGKHIDFEWQAQPEAQYYVFLLTDPGNLQERYKTFRTSTSQEIKTSPEGDTYKWSVLAYDADDNLLCNSETFILKMLQPGAKTGTPEKLLTDTPIAPEPPPATMPLEPAFSHTLTPIAPPVPAFTPTPIAPDEPPATEPLPTPITPDEPPAPPPADSTDTAEPLEEPITPQSPGISGPEE